VESLIEPANAPLQLIAASSVVVDGAPLEVFALVSSHTRLPEWVPGVLRVEVDDSGAKVPEGAGAVRTLIPRFGTSGRERITQPDRAALRMEYFAADESLLGLSASIIELASPAARTAAARSSPSPCTPGRAQPVCAGGWDVGCFASRRRQPVQTSPAICLTFADHVSRVTSQARSGVVSRGSRWRSVASRLDREIDQLGRVAPLVVVPGNQLHEGGVQLNARLGVE
jgi:hypothetical protein